jgi:hypothetical protein
MLSARRQTASRMRLCGHFHVAGNRRVEIHPLPGQARPSREASYLQAVPKSHGSALTRLTAVRPHSLQVISKKSIACTRLSRWHAFRNKAVQRDFGSPACALQPTRISIAWSRRFRTTCRDIRALQTANLASRNGGCTSGFATAVNPFRRIRCGSRWSDYSNLAWSRTWMSQGLAACGAVWQVKRNDR